MWVIFYVIFNLMFHTSELERTEIALDILNRAYPNWSEQYVVNEFDCSEMSAFVDDYLNFWRVDAEPICKMNWETQIGHRWLEVDGKIIECTILKIVDGDNEFYKQFTTEIINIKEHEVDWWNNDYIKGSLCVPKNKE